MRNNLHTTVPDKRTWSRLLFVAFEAENYHRVVTNAARLTPYNGARAEPLDVLGIRFLAEFELI
jgi:hypothetical protein